MSKPAWWRTFGCATTLAFCTWRQQTFVSRGTFANRKTFVTGETFVTRGKEAPTGMAPVGKKTPAYREGNRDEACSSVCSDYRTRCISRGPDAGRRRECADEPREDSFRDLYGRRWDELLALCVAPNVPVSAATAHDVVVLFDTSATQVNEYRARGLTALTALLGGLRRPTAYICWPWTLTPSR